jgi:riboflavin kinase
VRFGHVPGPAAAACLARMGQTAGLDLILTGRRFGAEEAGRLHLVSSVLPRDELDAAVSAVIADLLLGDYAALRAARRLVRQIAGPGMAERLRTARAAAQTATGSVLDHSEPGERHGFEVPTTSLVRDGRPVVSDTSLRSCVEAGDVALAASALGRRYRLDGIVEHGDHRGRALGFPTANLYFDRFAAVPADGIYAGRAVFLDQSWQADQAVALGAAAVSVGSNPTFGGRQRRVEAHILDFDGDLYGRRVGIEFSQRLRGMIRFDDAAALVAQMKRDVEQVREAARA